MYCGTWSGFHEYFLQQLCGVICLYLFVTIHAKSFNSVKTQFWQLNPQELKNVKKYIICSKLTNVSNENQKLTIWKGHNCTLFKISSFVENRKLKMDDYSISLRDFINMLKNSWTFASISDFQITRYWFCVVYTTKIAAYDLTIENQKPRMFPGFQFPIVCSNNFIGYADFPQHPRHAGYMLSCRLKVRMKPQILWNLPSILNFPCFKKRYTLL